ncbi:MAG: hypothetical protein H3C27_00655 [Opitutaceae bacterium]|nr:hypothetical protein [Opitutaceae bacterium]
MSETRENLLDAAEGWMAREPAIESAVLFGSSARAEPAGTGPDVWSDLDLHVITSQPASLETADWRAIFPGQNFLGQAVRAATGGVRKATVLFAQGQLDLVIVPRRAMRLARWGWRLGLHRRHARLREALNEIHTCIHLGFRQLKGEGEWGRFYAALQRDFPGVRLDDAAVRSLAELALVEQHWVRQKLARGELLAAQHRLHASLSDINLRLLRELRLRRRQTLPSFGLGRHAETLLPPDELAWVRVDARCRADELSAATDQALRGLIALLRELLPHWPVPPLLAVLTGGLKPAP